MWLLPAFKDKRLEFTHIKIGLEYNGNTINRDKNIKKLKSLHHTLASFMHSLSCINWVILQGEC